MIAYLPLVLAVVGLVLYFATDGKPSEVGRLAFAVGLAILVWMYRAVG
jgi:hypothetical protein